MGRPKPKGSRARKSSRICCFFQHLISTKSHEGCFRTVGPLTTQRSIFPGRSVHNYSFWPRGSVDSRSRRNRSRGHQDREVKTTRRYDALKKRDLRAKPDVRTSYHRSGTRPTLDHFLLRIACNLSLIGATLVRRFSLIDMQIRTRRRHRQLHQHRDAQIPAGR